jgi:Secretion system C-terminal sorting domain
MNKIISTLTLFFISFSLQAQNGAYGKCLYGEGVYNVGGNCSITLATYSISLEGKVLPNNFSELNYMVQYNRDLAKVELYSSNDGTTFTKKQTNIDIDNTVERKSYRFIDSNFAVANKFFYKVKGFSNSGNSLFSNVVFLSKKFNTNENVKVFPNPVKTYLTLSVPSSLLGTKISITLYSNKGQIILQKTFNSVNAIEKIFVENLASAVYSLNVITKESNETVEVIKK